MAADFYHVTTTGKDDENLAYITAQILQGGMLTLPGDIETKEGQIKWQKKGIFFSGTAIEDIADQDALDSAGGRPLMIVASCDFGNSWQLDYETDQGGLLGLFEIYEDDILNFRDIDLVDGLKISSVEPISEPVKGLRINVSDQQGNTHKLGILYKDIKVDYKGFQFESYSDAFDATAQNLGAQIDASITTLYWNLGEVILAEPKLLEVLRNTLIAHKAEGYLQAERNMKKELYDNDSLMNLKYSVEKYGWVSPNTF
jgi:hypothetical protein